MAHQVHLDRESFIWGQIKPSSTFLTLKVFSNLNDSGICLSGCSQPRAENLPEVSEKTLQSN